MAKNKDVLLSFVIGALLVVMAIGGTMWFAGVGPFAATDEQQQQAGTAPSGAPVNLNSCPDTKVTTVTLDVQNTLNSSGADTFDAAYYLRGTNGDLKTGSDTTAGSISNVNCGEEYTLEIVRADGDGADNSRITSVLLGPGAVVEDGKVRFKPTGATYSLRVAVSQHGVLEFRAFDQDNNGYIYDTSDATATDYETDGVTFSSTTANATATAVGAGGSLHWVIDARSTAADTDFNDFYTLILVEAPVATWEEPTIKVDGVKVADVKGSLTSDEEKAFSNYEYIYKIDKSILDGNDGIKVDVYFKAIDGVDPSTDPEMDFASAGRFLSKDGVSTKVGAADDTSSSTVVFAVQDTTLNIS